MSTRCQLRCFDDPRCCYDEPAVTVVADTSNEERQHRLAKCGATVSARRWNVGSGDDLPEADAHVRDPEREQQVEGCGVSASQTSGGPAAQLIELLNLPGQQATVFRQGGSLVLKLGSAPCGELRASMCGRDPRIQAWASLDEPDPWELEEDNFRGFEEVGTLEGGVRDFLSVPSQDSEGSMWLSLRAGSSSSIDGPKITFSLGQPEARNVTEDEVYTQELNDQKKPCIIRLGSPLQGHMGEHFQPLGDTCEQLRNDPGQETNIGLEDKNPKTYAQPNQEMTEVQIRAQETARTETPCSDFESF